MYHVYSVRKGSDKYYIMCHRVNLSKEEAIAFKAQRMANPNRICEYVIVSVKRDKEFLADVAKKSAPLEARAKAIEDRKEKRWQMLDEMYKKGYRVNDTLAFVNK